MDPVICKICGNTFIPKKNQKRAFWAMNWCAWDAGLLCPKCHEAAEELHAVFDQEPAMCRMPWKSDIAKKSKAVPKEDVSQICRDESWRTWVETNHPEWVEES